MTRSKRNENRERRAGTDEGRGKKRTEDKKAESQKTEGDAHPDGDCRRSCGSDMRRMEDFHQSVGEEEDPGRTAGADGRLSERGGRNQQVL